MRVLIIGATGAVGSRILSRVLALPNSPTVRVSSRDLSKAHFPSTVEAVQADMNDPSSYSRLFTGVDRCFLYMQTTAPLTPLCQAAKAAAVQRVVLLSSFTVQAIPETAIALMHSKAEHAVLEAGLPHTFLRAGYFARNTVSWMAEAEKSGQVSLPYPNAHFAPVTEDDIADVAVVALTTDRLLDAAPLITGPKSLTSQQMVAQISALRQREGASALSVAPISLADWRASSGMKPGIQDTFVTLWQLRDGKPEEVHASEKWSGIPSVSFEHYLEQNKAAYIK